MVTTVGEATGDDTGDEDDNDNPATAAFRGLSAAFTLSTSASNPCWASWKFCWVMRSSSSLVSRLASVDWKEESSGDCGVPFGSAGFDGAEVNGERTNGRGARIDGVLVPDVPCGLDLTKIRGMREGATRAGGIDMGTPVIFAVIERSRGNNPNKSRNDAASGSTM